MKVRYTVAALLLLSTVACGQSSSPTRPTPSCSFTLSPTTQSVPAAGGSFSAAVTTTSACGWTAAADVSWILVTSGSSGTASGTIQFSVAVNTDSSRQGTIIVHVNDRGSVKLVVTQAARAK